jgi:hypothetical protein
LLTIGCCIIWLSIKFLTNPRLSGFEYLWLM